MNAHSTVVSAMKDDENAVTVAVNNTVPAQSSFLIASQSLMREETTSNTARNTKTALYKFAMFYVDVTILSRGSVQ